MATKILVRSFLILLIVLMMATACTKAPDAGPITLPNRATVAHPQEPITLKNVRNLDALSTWQLPGQVTHVLFAPDGKTIYAAVGTARTSTKGQLYRWQLDDSQGPQVMLETQGAINALFLSPDHRYLVYGTQGNELVLYDLEASKAGANLLNTGKGVTAAAWSPSEQMLAWAMFEDYAYYQYLNGSQSGQFGYRLGTTTDMAFTPDGKEVALAREDGSLFIIDTSGWQLIKSIPIADASKERLSWLGASPDGSLMAVSGGDMGTLWVVDTASWKPVVTIQAGIGLNRGAFSPDGQMVLVGNNNNSVTIVSLPTKNFDSALKLADSPVLCVAFSPDGTMLLIGDRNGQVRLLAAQQMINPEALPAELETPAP
jgi:tricorn protease-like protein